MMIPFDSDDDGDGDDNGSDEVSLFWFFLSVALLLGFDRACWFFHIEVIIPSTDADDPDPLRITGLEPAAGGGGGDPGACGNNAPAPCAMRLVPPPAESLAPVALLLAPSVRDREVDEDEDDDRNLGGLYASVCAKRSRACMSAGATCGCTRVRARGARAPNTRGDAAQWAHSRNRGNDTISKTICLSLTWSLCSRFPPAPALLLAAAAAAAASAMALGVLGATMSRSRTLDKFAAKNGDDSSSFS
mmetsp:Transcript_30114/g.58961  ORF Transcript_30114/g.58961 Transcript_30114/m.58961 type:complete len:246 (+) Transcript_30114:1256-1993(+)